MNAIKFGQPAPVIKTYTRHRCTRRHRSYRTLALCIWQHAEWVYGNGEYASVAYCRRVVTVELHTSLANALRAKAFIDYVQCGHACSNKHEIIRLTLKGRP